MQPKNKKSIIVNCWALLMIVTFNLGIATAFALEKHEIAPEILLSLMNGSRREAGLSELSPNAQLALAAEQKVNDMFEFQYFEHESPAGKTPWIFIRSAGYEYAYAGENLAMDFVSAEGVHKALMESSSHRENILNVNYSDAGISARKGLFEGEETIIVVEMFGSPVKKPAAAKTIEPEAQAISDAQKSSAIKKDQAKEAVQVASRSEIAKTDAVELADDSKSCKKEGAREQADEKTEMSEDLPIIPLFAQNAFFIGQNVHGADAEKGDFTGGYVAGIAKKQNGHAKNNEFSAGYEKYSVILDLFKKEIALLLLSFAISMNIYYSSGENGLE